MPKEDEHYDLYLEGKKFSTALKYPPFDQAGTRLVARDVLIEELVRGRSVLHIGCCDHIPNIVAKHGQSLLLHQKLRKVTTNLVGVDINEEGIQLLRELGEEDVYTYEEFNDSDFRELRFDICLVPDVIEHVENPSEFIKSIKDNYCFDRLIVTTPNAYALKWAISCSYEKINSDHLCYFSPYTLTKVLHKNGFNRVGQYFTTNPPRYNFLKSIFLKKFPLKRSDLVFVAN